MPSISFDNQHFDSPDIYAKHWVSTSISQSWTDVAWTYTTFKIYKGTEPSDFSGFTTKTAYDSDLLFTVLPADQSGAPTFTQVVSGETYSVNFTQDTPVIATASGTATWFWGYADGTSNNTGTTPRLMCRGTVGATGSGADIEIADTNIVAGNSYLILNLKFLIPLTITW